MKWLPIVFSLLLAAHGQPLLIDFPVLPVCASTTTVTLGGIYTVTSTSTVTSATSTITVTAPPSVSVVRSTTTVLSATSITCLSTATTFSPYPALLGTLEVRAPQITLPTLCPSVPTVTIIPPTVSSGPCTRIDGDFDITTTTVTSTTQGVSTTTTTPTETQTVTETWIQPTPTSHDGLNYYQYINGYNYNSDTTGLGGGGFSSSHWSFNSSYYTSGLARNINFESPTWPTGPAVCQLPGQSSATDCTQWTVVFQGFIFASVPGVYTVHSPTAADSPNWQDNAGFWWGGEKAYSQFGDENVDGAAVPRAISGVGNTVAYELVAGEFLPFTFIFANGQGPAANRVSVTTPNGRVYPEDLDVFVPPCDDSAFVP